MTSPVAVEVRTTGRLAATCCGCLDLRTGCLVIASALIVIEIIGSVGSVVSLELLGRQLENQLPKLVTPLTSSENASHHGGEEDVSANTASGADNIQEKGPKSSETFEPVVLEVISSEVNAIGGGKVGLSSGLLEVPLESSSSVEGQLSSSAQTHFPILRTSNKRYHRIHHHRFNTEETFTDDPSNLDDTLESYDELQTSTSIAALTKTTTDHAPDDNTSTVQIPRNLIQITVEDALVPNANFSIKVADHIYSRPSNSEKQRQSSTRTIATTTSTSKAFSNGTSTGAEESLGLQQEVNDNSKEATEIPMITFVETSGDWHPSIVDAGRTRDRRQEVHAQDIIFTVEEARRKRTAHTDAVIPGVVHTTPNNDSLKKYQPFSSNSSSHGRTAHNINVAHSQISTTAQDNKLPQADGGHPTSESSALLREMSALSVFSWRALLAVAILLVLVTLACNVILIFGAHRNSACCVLVWLIWHGAVFIASTVGAVVSAFQHASCSSKQDRDVTASPHVEGLSSAPEAVSSACAGVDGDPVLPGLLVAAGFGVVAFYWYCFVVVLSFHLELRQTAGRKTSV